MAFDAFWLVLASLLAVPLSWCLPRRFAMDAVAVFSVAALAAVSWRSALWLLGSSALTVGALAWARHVSRPGLIHAACAVVLTLGLLLPREFRGWELAGVAYFTLRNLHVLLEGWMGRGQRPGLREMWRYQCFLPVLLVGPIHRLAPFQRELNIRRFDWRELALGAERALLGLAMATILGTSLLMPLQGAMVARWGGEGHFWAGWALSALQWVQLYAVFAGLSGFAVGVSRMMGIRMEENFDRPFQSTSLLDFWQRWHISLSTWCRDHVFHPVSAATRQPVLGLAAAMLVIGLWHETSFYYVLWSAWQVLGIVLNRLLIGWAQRPGLSWPEPVRAWLAPVCVLAYLSLARPVILALLQSGS
jgi:alginate O-acetyltransferase complex protein AlgI